MRGHIRKRGKSYSIVVDVGYDDNGKRKQKWFSGYKSEKAAEKDLARVLSKLHDETYVEPSTVLYGTFLKDWLMNVAKYNIASSTLEVYVYHMNNLILPNIGHIPLADLKPIHIQKLYGQLRQQHLKGSTILKTHNIVRSSLQYAYRTDMVLFNVADKVDKPKNTKEEMKAWTQDEVRAFLSIAEKHKDGIFFYLMLATGMRPGELLALRWSDINPEEQVISVRRSQNRDMEIKAPKTKSGIRQITIDKETVRRLKKHLLIQKEKRMSRGYDYENNDLVICTERGTPFAHRNILRTWYKLLRECEKLQLVSTIRMYDLRHTHATILLEKGIHIKVVSERLGHSSVRVTLDEYSHVLPSMQKEAADKLENLFTSSFANENANISKSHDQS